MKYAKDATGRKLIPGDIVHHILFPTRRYEVISLYCHGLDCWTKQEDVKPLPTAEELADIWRGTVMGGRRIG